MNMRLIAKEYCLRFLAVLLIFIAAPVFAKYSGGAGEPNDPYLISCADDLNALGVDFTDWGKCFKLTADINMAAYPADVYKIIGTTQSMNFSGIFDGDEHIIQNFRCSIPSPSNMYVGLFGYTSNAVIKNLHLEDVNITSVAHSTGAIVGVLSNGSIINCSSKGFVKSTGTPSLSYSGGLAGRLVDGNIINCYTEGIVSNISNSSDTISRAGGLAGGLLGGNINKSFSTASVILQTSFLNMDYSSAGGLAGYCDGNIINCYSRGSITCSSSLAYAGGFIGNQNNTSSKIEDCYSIGQVSGTGAHVFKGGFISYSLGTITSCFWDVNSSGQPTSAGGTGKTTAEMKTLSTFINAGWDFNDVWRICEGFGYPRLRSFGRYSGGSGTPIDPYQIATPCDLMTLANDINDYNKCFLMTADIDLDPCIPGNKVFTSALIGPAWFKGTFDGNQHKIINLTIYSGGSTIHYYALFGWIDNTGVVKNLGLENVSVSGGGSQGTGALAGYNNGTISNCFSTGNVIGGDSTYWIGGLVGGGSGNISNSFSTCNVTGYISMYAGGLVGDCSGYITNCYSTGNVTGGDYLQASGGFAGQVGYGTISNCYSTGKVSCGAWSFDIGGFAGEMGEMTEPNIINCYSTGDVNCGNGSSSIGGFIGQNQGNIIDCYSTGKVAQTSPYTGGFAGSVNFNWNIIGSYFLQSAGLNNGYGTPLTDAQMKQQSSFVGWDFTTTWRMRCEGMNYPKLNWQAIPEADFGCPDGVNFIDYAFFSNRWMNTNCAANNDCDGTDFDFSGTVDIDDLKVFCGYWLEGL